MRRFYRKDFIFSLILILFFLLALNVVSGYSDSPRIFTKLPDGWYAPDKDPAAVLDYQIDWTLWLGEVTDTIIDSSWTATTGITIDGSSFTTLKTTVWLSGGTLNTTYTVTNRIWTAGGRITEQSFKIRLRDL